MGLVLMNDADTDPDPLITHGDMGEIWRPNWVIDEETGLPIWSGTWEVRENSSRQFMTSIDNLFNNRIKAAAYIWHNVLEEEDRAWWKTVSADRSGARPGMKMECWHGWHLFAMYALAIVSWPALEDFNWANKEGWGLDSITFDEAVSANGMMTFSLSYTTLPPPGATDFIMTHQVDPKHIDRRDATRRTMMVGYHAVTEESEKEHSFTANAVYLFAPGDKVQVLIREHITSLCVKNYLLTCTAT